MPKGLTTGIIFIPLDVRWPRNRKVRPLIVHHGVEGLAAWSLYLAMASYCRENLSDGWVPADEIGALAYPLPIEQAEQLVKLLADYRLVSEPHSEPHSGSHSGPHSEPHHEGYFVRGYVKRNGTRAETLDHAAKQAAAGKLGARSRWSAVPHSEPHDRGHRGRPSDSHDQTKTESETRSRARPREGWTPHDALDSEPKRSSGRPTPPPAKDVIAQRYSPSDDPDARAAEARKALNERPRPLPAETDPEPPAALHGEDLARAQLAESRAGRIPDVPAADPGDEPSEYPF